VIDIRGGQAEAPVSDGQMYTNRSSSFVAAM
jgi:hypothetical protein